MEDFSAMLCRAVPLHEELIEMQWQTMRMQVAAVEAELRAMTPGDPLSLEEIKYLQGQFEEQQLHRPQNKPMERMLVARHVVRGLRGLVYTMGDSRYAFHEKEGAIAEGTSFPLTDGKRFLPNVADAIYFRVWPVVDAERFLGHVYDWYVSAYACVPEYFRRNEWEFVVDSEGELLVRLTGKQKTVEQRFKRERAHSNKDFVQATVVRLTKNNQE